MRRFLFGSVSVLFIFLNLSCDTAVPTDPVTSAAGALTGTSIDQEVKSALTELSNVGADLTGDTLIAVNGASANLGALGHQFDELAKDHLDAPINTLGSDVRDTGIQLNSMATRINQLVNYQHDRVYDDVAVFQASLETITLEAKKGVFFIKDGSPRAYYFTFDALKLPNYVPKTGGRVSVTGYRLWESVENSPTVEFCNGEDRKVIAPATPGRAANDNDLSIDIPADLIKQHAGQELAIHIVPKDKKGNPTSDLYLPMVIPQDYVTQFKILGGVAYSTDQNVRQTLAQPQRFGADNASCEHRIAVNTSHAWTLQHGQRIVDFTQKVVSQRENNGIVLTITGLDRITASGWLDTADCIMVGFVHKLRHHAEWQVDVSPIIEYSVSNPKTTSSESAPVDVSLPTTTLTLDLQNDATLNGSFWFTVVPVIKGVAAKALYESPHTMYSPHGGTAASVEVSHYLITGTFNPTPVNGKGQIAVVITTPRAK